MLTDSPNTNKLLMLISSKLALFLHYSNFKINILSKKIIIVCICGVSSCSETFSDILGLECSCLCLLHLATVRLFQSDPPVKNLDILSREIRGSLTTILPILVFHVTSMTIYGVTDCLNNKIIYKSVRNRK